MGAPNYQYNSTAKELNYPPPNKQSRPPKKRQSNRVVYAVFLGCVLTIFICACIYMYASVQFSIKQTELRNLNTKVQQLESSINTVEANIISKLDLANIKQQAIQELGMSEPLPHQIIYINLPEESYVTYGK
ncbi:hypothetical protein AN396_01945 [Candidatus Epulonipiscium fishelsonii]|uniref:Uncharacterized protein n=1 Tax=Candidatus Epulonipiscium fishelsonii TaxID=77094 RepID=A0ACC8XFP1_9FIRM|nr:hypothetical protein AN396_01945 [Epulopiscium sp. SCG-B11WGA-EpuloA1]